MPDATDTAPVVIERAPQRGEQARYELDPWSARRFLAKWMSDTTNVDSALLRRETSEDAYYRYPYGVLDEIPQKDMHAAALISIRKQAVLDCEMTMTPVDETPLAMRIADFCSWAIEQLDDRDGQDWRSVTDSLLDAVPYGFRVSEFIWNTGSWDGQAYWIMSAIKARKHRRFTFGTENELLMINAQMQSAPVPADKFVIARLYPADDSPWGDPLLAKIYMLYLFKKAVWAYWIAYCEKFGQPLPVGSLTEEFTGSDAEIAKFDDMLAGIQQEGFARLAKGQELDFKEFGRADTNELYKGFITAANREMSKLWVGATMILEESAVGTQAMSAVLEGRFLSKVASDARAVSRVWTKSILYTLVKVNFGAEVAATLTPTMTLAVSEQKDLAAEAAVVKILIEAGLPLSKNDLYATFGRARPSEDDPDDWLVKKPEPKPQLAPGQQQPGMPALQQAPTKDDEQADAEGKQFAESARFDSMAIARAADADREKVIADKQMNAAVRAGFEDVLTQLKQQMKQAGSLRALIDAPVMPIADTAKLAAALTGMYKLAHLRGLLKNVANLRFVGIADKQQFAAENAQKDMLNVEDQRLFAETGEFDSLTKVIDRVTALEILTRPEFDQLDDWARSLAFTAAGQTVDTLQEGLRSLVLDSIESGDSLDQSIAKVRAYWQPLKGAAGKANEAMLTEAHIENVVRTNTMRAYNQGWNDVAYSEGMADRFPAAEFVAIIDERTTDTCRLMNGRVLTREAAQSCTPPLHYQCRSVIVWLSTRDMSGYSADKMLTRDGLARLPAKEQPMAGFGAYTPLFGGRG